MSLDLAFAICLHYWIMCVSVLNDQLEHWISNKCNNPGENNILSVTKYVQSFSSKAGLELIKSQFFENLFI